jgi:molybdopterin-guanine dinucleotide biosynthesis protein A
LRATAAIASATSSGLSEAAAAVPVGVVLAGGEGRRLLEGEPGLAAGRHPSKPAVPVAGRPLISYPVDALSAVCRRVAVVAKRDTELPPTAAELWVEPDVPRHPLTGLVHALERAGAPVLACAGDMPFVTDAACHELIAVGRRAGALVARAGNGLARPVIAATDAGLEPLLGLYPPSALPALRAAPADAPLRATVAGLDPVRLPMPAGVVRSVNTRADLAAAEAELGAGSYRLRAGSRTSTATSTTA